jgi:hypothetical protein
MALTQAICLVIPAKAGIQFQNAAAVGRNQFKIWIPAFAGMTAKTGLLTLKSVSFLLNPLLRERAGRGDRSTPLIPAFSLGEKEQEHRAIRRGEHSAYFDSLATATKPQ